MNKQFQTHFHFFIFLQILFLINPPTGFTQGNRRMTRAEYVDSYKDMAIREMYEFKIPASIKLAQAILESGDGNSRLAREGNNHFGIKCHGWQGDFMRVDDDAPKECFRKYDNADQSYKDHSAFLANRPRYAFLFDLEITDYKGWAKGLKKAGYATNPRYADMLIKIIEDLELYKYDRMYPAMLAEKTGKEEKTKKSDKHKTLVGVKAQRKIFTNNGTKYILAEKGDDFFKISQDFNIYSFQIWKYNELTSNDKLNEGDMVYIEKKKRKAEEPFHTVTSGETMRAIAQKYGIRLNRLYRINRMSKDEKPRIGQTLWLQDRKPVE
jgi:LysM repeat protein